MIYIYILAVANLEDGEGKRASPLHHGGTRLPATLASSTQRGSANLHQTCYVLGEQNLLLAVKRSRMLMD